MSSPDSEPTAVMSAAAPPASGQPGNPAIIRSEHRLLVEGDIESTGPDAQASASQVWEDPDCHSITMPLAAISPIATTTLIVASSPIHRTMFHVKHHPPMSTMFHVKHQHTKRHRMKYRPPTPRSWVRPSAFGTWMTVRPIRASTTPPSLERPDAPLN